jgi:hypothetical protein
MNLKEDIMDALDKIYEENIVKRKGIDSEN